MWVIDWQHPASPIWPKLCVAKATTAATTVRERERGMFHVWAGDGPNISLAISYHFHPPALKHAFASPS